MTFRMGGRSHSNYPSYMHYDVSYRKEHLTGRHTMKDSSCFKKSFWICVYIPVWPGVQWAVEAAIHLHCFPSGSSFWILLLRPDRRQVRKMLSHKYQSGSKTVFWLVLRYVLSHGYKAGHRATVDSFWYLTYCSFLVMLHFVTVGDLFSLVQSLGQQYDTHHSQRWKLNVFFHITSCRFGRRPVMFAMLAFQSISTIIAVFSPSWTMFAFFYFITGVGRVSSYVSAFVLGKYEKCMLLTLSHFDCFMSFYGRISSHLTFMPPCAILQALRSWVAESESCFHLWVFA